MAGTLRIDPTVLQHAASSWRAMAREIESLETTIGHTRQLVATGDPALDADLDHVLTSIANQVSQSALRLDAEATLLSHSAATYEAADSVGHVLP